LIVTGEPARALERADRVLQQARRTGSMKYEARALALRGQVLLDAGQSALASGELALALALARRMGYPNLTWQAAHLLARAEAAGGRMEEAAGAAQLAVQTLDELVARLPDAALRRTFLGWSRVGAVREEVDRLRRT